MIQCMHACDAIDSCVAVEFEAQDNASCCGGSVDMQCSFAWGCDEYPDWTDGVWGDRDDTYVWVQRLQTAHMGEDAPAIDVGAAKNVEPVMDVGGTGNDALAACED